MDELHLWTLAMYERKTIDLNGKDIDGRTHIKLNSRDISGWTQFMNACINLSKQKDVIIDWMVKT